MRRTPPTATRARTAVKSMKSKITGLKACDNTLKSCRSCFFFAPWCDDADGCAGPHDYGSLVIYAVPFSEYKRNRAKNSSRSKLSAFALVALLLSHLRGACSSVFRPA